MKNCKDCDNNYLLELFNRCLDKHEIYNDALEEFNALCTRCKDPRSSVMILYNLLNNVRNIKIYINLILHKNY